jgi:hypothetical protein
MRAMACSCSGTARLAGGTIAYAGTTSNTSTFTIAITGGTKALKGAEGQVTIHNLDANGNVSRDVIELTG